MNGVCEREMNLWDLDRKVMSSPLWPPIGSGQDPLWYYYKVGEEERLTTERETNDKTVGH